jgi:hypothetical protein
MVNFNLETVRNLSNKPQHLKIMSFHVILEEIKKLIHNRASQGHVEISYVIPPFLLGYPPYNVLDCASFIYHHFHREKFKVNMTKNTLCPDKIIIHINWKKDPNEVEPDVFNTSNNKNNNKKKNTNTKTKKTKKQEQSDNQKTMNFFHKSGYMDSIPVNTKSMYL